MTDGARSEVDISAVLDVLINLEKFMNPDYVDRTVEYIVRDLKKLNEERPETTEEEKKKKEEEAYCIQILNDALRNDPSGKLAKTKLISQSRSEMEDTLISGCAFEAEDRTFYVAYRGTEDGQWVDDGEGMYKPDTAMQQDAAEYFDYLVEKYNLTEGSNVIVTGHSKGGNMAQYVTLASKYYRLVDYCFSYDGQGFSRSAIEGSEDSKGFKEKLGEDYSRQIEKMYSINGENDFVHIWGIPVIQSDHTFYVATPGAPDFANLHSLQYMVEGGRVDLDNPVAQGIIGQFAKRLGEEMMKLSDEDLEDSALAIMSILELFASGENKHLVGLGDERFASIEEFCGFISVGIPTVLKTALLTEEGRALVALLAMNAITGIAESENGGLKLAGITALVLFCAPAVLALGTGIWALATIGDVALGVFDGVFELSDIPGAAIVAAVIINAGVFLAAHPEIVAAVLAVVAVVSLINFFVEHREEISAFIKGVGDFSVGIAVAICAWAENLVTQAVSLLKAGIGLAVKAGEAMAQAIVDFTQRLIDAAVGFFTGMAQAVADFFSGVGSWIGSLFGSGQSALTYGYQIVVTITYIEELQGRLGTLKNKCVDIEVQIRDADGTVTRVHGYYRESYVRSCCRDIQGELRNAQRYLSDVQRDLDRRRRALSTAVEAYRRSDQNAAKDIRNFSLT